jgi:hypothetical protein
LWGALLMYGRLVSIAREREKEREEKEDER